MANHPHVVDERRARIRSPRSRFAIDQPPPPTASAPLVDMHDLAQVTAYVLAAFFLAIASPSEAQTGHDLLTLCISKNAVEQMSCKLYIAGFVDGMQASDDLQGEVCVPKTLTGNDATMIFTETLANIELAAALGKGIGRDPNPFFRGPQNSALAAALAMKFKCAKKPSAK